MSSRYPHQRRPSAPRKSEVSSVIHLVNSLASATSPTERRFAQDKLGAALLRYLQTSHEAVLHEALEQQWSADEKNYALLLDTLEPLCETTLYSDNSGPWDVQLIAMPVLAWSRENIPAGSFGKARADAIGTFLRHNLLTRSCHITITDWLFSHDQLPQSFVETYQLTQRLSNALARHENVVTINSATIHPAMRFLADIRYMLAAVSAPAGAPLFVWQEADERTKLLERWYVFGNELAPSLLPGCATLWLPPAGYHNAWRQAERTLRPFNLQASLTYLQTMFGVERRDLQAILAVVEDDDVEEIRVGFTVRGQAQVVHGLVWPQLDDDDESTDTLALVHQLLHREELAEILSLPGRFAAEYCEDCGMPLYPNASGEFVHPETLDARTHVSASLH